MRDDAPDGSDAATDEPRPPRLPAGVDLAQPVWWTQPDPNGEAALMRALAPQPRTVRRYLRPRSLAIAAAGLAAALALLALGYQWGDRQPPPRGTEFALAATSLQPDAVAVGRIDETANGTWIRLDVGALEPADPGEYYEAWLTDGDALVSAGTFHMRGEPSPVVLWAGVSPVGYPELIVTVQDEGDSVASEQVVLRGSVGP